ncbi:MAG: hypothetical protein ACRC9Z_10325 [Weissella confusa]
MEQLVKLLFVISSLRRFITEVWLDMTVNEFNELRLELSEVVGAKFLPAGGVAMLLNGTWYKEADDVRKAMKGGD